MMRGKKRLVFLDPYSLLVHIANVGVSGDELQHMLCFGFGQDLALEELGREGILDTLQLELGTNDRAWLAALRDFALAAWRLAEREHRVSIHSPSDRWPWSPLNDLLRHHGLPPIWQLEPPVPLAKLGPDALGNARCRLCDYRWVRDWINRCSDALRVGMWRGGPLVGWPPYFDLPPHR